MHMTLISERLFLWQILYYPGTLQTFLTLAKRTHQISTWDHCRKVPLALFQFNRQKIIKLSLFWVPKTNFLRTDVFQSTCFCTFKTHLPCCLLLDLWEFPHAALEATSTSLKYSGNKEKIIGVHLSRSVCTWPEWCGRNKKTTQLSRAVVTCSKHTLISSWGISTGLIQTRQMSCYASRISDVKW